jgi:hypothetical protein
LFAIAFRIDDWPIDGVCLCWDPTSSAAFCLPGGADPAWRDEVANMKTELFRLRDRHRRWHTIRIDADGGPVPVVV